ncbi:MAG: acyl-CoA dehydrogenase family protein [Thermodesulfobacteriota bacterium]
MISLELPEKLQNVQQSMRQMAESMFRPIARKYDELEHEYPNELEAFRNMPIMGGGSKKKKSGAEQKKSQKEPRAGENFSTILTVEELSRGDVALLLSIPNAGLGNASIAAVGSDEQKERFGNKWVAMAITEPEAGSDSGGINTTAELDGEEWVLNGEKIFVTCADRCDAVVVWATVDKSAGKEGIKPFIVEKGTPGLTLDHLEHKLGIRASDTGTFVLNNCRIPRANIMGSPEISQDSEGFKGVMKTFDNTRPMVAAMSVGVAQAALDFLREKMEEYGFNLDYTKSSHFISSMEKEYYNMEAHLETMRFLTWRAAFMADNNEFNNVEASMAKAKAGRYGTLITQKCAELLGPLGFSRDYLAEKWMRDSKILDIFEGTGQIQHLIVARNILNLSKNELQ